MPEPGDVLGNQYRIIDIYSGGMGEVFICDRVKDQTEEASLRLALKTFKQQFFFDNATQVAFIREATIWSRLSGLPHIMPLLRLEEIGDRPFLVMLAVPPGPDGERTVADLLKSGPLDAASAFKYAFQLALALQQAANHVENLVHGDLKPANILLINDEVYLTDFGLVTAVSLGKADYRLESTWAYRAPELWADKSRSPTVATDLYAFGSLLFEMLVGQTPFQEKVHDRDAWENAHLHKAPRIPANFPTDELSTETMALAMVCLEKTPADRPHDFAEVFGRMNGVYKEHDPINHLMYLMRAQQWKATLWDQTSIVRRENIRNLLAMGEPHQALIELDNIEQVDYDAELWLRRGTALSLLDRDEEALPCFERAQAGPLSPSEQINCQVEHALTLKRLHRFEEAREIYQQLIPIVSDEQLPLVVVNLATVFLTQQNNEKVIDLLEPFVRRMPESAPAWANLGLAYMLVQRYKDAEKALGRALILTPRDGRLRVMLAELYMDHLGRFEEAFAALDAAFDSGYESREWLVRTLICSIVLERNDYIDGLLLALRENFEEDLANSIIEETKQKLAKLEKKYTSGQMPETEPSADDNLTSDSNLTEYPNDVEQAQREPESDTAPIQNDRQSSPGIPFLNFRFYDFLDFTIDYYQLPDNPDYVDSFLTEWRRAIRDPQLAHTGATLRGSPFYFTQCSKCHVYVLTNRDIGKTLRCRMCENPEPTKPIQNEQLDSIVEHISETIGIQQTSHESVVHGLYIQTPADVDVAEIRQICEQSGLIQMKSNQLLAIFLHKEFVKRGGKLDAPWTAWILYDLLEEAWAEEATPWKISLIVKDLALAFPGLQSLSTTLTATDASKMEISVQDVWQQEEERCRAAIYEGRANASNYRQLAIVLMQREEFEEGEQYARAAVAVDNESAGSWEILGQILFKQSEFQGALNAFETSLALNPNSVLTLYFMAACCEKIGDETRAHDFYTRASSLSGGEFPWKG